MTFDLSCIITGHRQGRSGVASLRAFDQAVREAEKLGLAVERQYCLDRPDALTRAVFAAFAGPDGTVHEDAAGDEGLARNQAAARASGRYIAFVGADDLWSRDWLVKAVNFVANCGDRVVAHAQYVYTFGNAGRIFCHIDQDDPRFDLDLLRLRNYWSSAFVCAASVCREFPFVAGDLEPAGGDGGWHWNCETVAAGLRHKIVPETVMFTRDRSEPQTEEVTLTRPLARPNALSSYASALYGDQKASTS